MNEKIQEYAKRLKLSWIRRHYHEVEAKNQEEFLLKLFEKEIEQREERKINLLFKSATTFLYTSKELSSFSKSSPCVTKSEA